MGMTKTILRGPTDADHYRVKVGRYSDRWYHDPLPSCPIAQASDWSGPSWSIVKGAAGKDWSFVTNKRNAHTDRAELERIATLEPEQRAQAFNLINKNGLSQAGGRGTIVHLWAEDLLAGGSPRELTDVDLMAMWLPALAYAEALTYRDAIVAFFDTYQPEMIAAEYVALHRTLNGVGYGCTPDVVARVNGQILGVDWKTRGIDSDHGAYPEEAAQIAAGARAEYMIIAGPDGNPIRAAIPQMDGGIVVSIRPDGCRVYPVDLDKAFEHTVAMHAFWCARRSEKVSIGKPWAPKVASVPSADVEPTGGTDAAISVPPVDDIDTTPTNQLARAESAYSPGNRCSTCGAVATRYYHDAGPFGAGTFYGCESCAPNDSPKLPELPDNPEFDVDPPDIDTLDTAYVPTDEFVIVADDGRRGKVTIPSSRTQLRASLAKLIDAGHEAVIRRLWPAGVPPLSQPGHSVDQLTQLFYLVRRVEAEVGAPFDPEPVEPSCRCGECGGRVTLIDHRCVDCGTQHGDKPLPPPPLDDGAFLDTREVDTLKARMLALPDDRIVILADIAREAQAAGRPISVQQKPCVRRWEIARALVLWAEGGTSLDHLALGVSSVATRPQIAGCDTVGAVISQFTISQAVTLAEAFEREVAA